MRIEERERVREGEREREGGGEGERERGRILESTCIYMNEWLDQFSVVLNRFYRLQM